MGAKEDREKEKTSRETLGKFFYDLAKMTFGTTVLGEFAAVFGFTDFSLSSVVVLLFGSFMTAGFAYLGNSVLKGDKDMEALAITFVWGSIIVAGLIVWINTKSGKKWLEEL